MRRRLPFFFLVLCLMCPEWAAAQDPDPASGGSTPATLHGKLELSLADAIAMGIENNLGVEIQRHAPLIAFEDSRIAWGAYDPEFFGDMTYFSRETPIASTLQTSTRLVEREFDAGAGFRGLFPKVGGRWEVRYDGNRLQTTSAIQSLSPQYTTTVLGTVQLPLLKGLWWGEPWTRVKTSKVGWHSSEEAFRQALMDLVQGIESGYWQLIADEEQFRVSQKSLETARALLERTEAQYEVGVVSRVEVVEAEAGVAEREVSLIRAENRYQNQQDVLIDLVLGVSLTPESRLQIEPTDRPDDYVLYEIDVEKAVEKATDLRPELAQARKNIEQEEIELAFARNQRLPQLDLVGTYGYAGLAGRTNPLPSPFMPGPRAPVTSVRRRYSSTDDDFFSADGAKQWSGGAVLSIPLGKVEGRHGVSKAALELRRARTELKQTYQGIVKDIREKARNLRSSQEGIEAAERRRLAAAEQYRAENIRLEHGESTPFDVLEREEQLFEAESQKIDALRVYRVSVTDLDRAQGTILQEKNIVVEDAARLR